MSMRRLLIVVTRKLKQKMSTTDYCMMKISEETPEEIFVMEFSKDGKYLAAAGRDSVIRIWKVISSPLARMEFNQLRRRMANHYAATNEIVF